MSVFWSNKVAEEKKAQGVLFKLLNLSIDINIIYKVLAQQRPERQSVIIGRPEDIPPKVVYIYYSIPLFSDIWCIILLRLKITPPNFHLLFFDFADYHSTM